MFVAFHINKQINNILKFKAVIRKVTSIKIFAVYSNNKKVTHSSVISEEATGLLRDDT